MFIKLLKFYMPDPIRKKKLDDLFRLTADAFQCEVPALQGLSFAERLTRYASFTAEQADRCFQWEGSPDERKRKLDAVEEKLYRNSLLFGKNLKKSLRIKNWKQAVEALELVYRIIGIDFRCGGPTRRGNGRLRSGRLYRGSRKNDGPYEFIIKKCFFSSRYTAEICSLISALDKGLAAGLSGGGNLRFSQRITEGCGCCRGYFNPIKQ